jgi:hypothetical protein
MFTLNKKRNFMKYNILTNTIKNLNVIRKTKYLIAAAFSLSGMAGMAQFQDASGNTVTECDCIDPIRYLDVTISLPDNYTTYDYIQFVLYADGQGISTRTMKPNDINASSIKLNVLNEANDGSTSLLGVEYGLFHGNDFQLASYNSLCEFKSDVNLHVVALGISQIGTETVYELDASKTKVIGTTFNIYDDGVELSKSEPVKFKQDGVFAAKLERQWWITYGVGAATFVGAILPIAIMSGGKE